MSARTTFQTAILAGLPAQLPAKQERDPSVSHAPRRVVEGVLSEEEKVLAVQNALRYFPVEWHRELAAVPCATAFSPDSATEQSGIVSVGDEITDKFCICF